MFLGRFKKCCNMFGMTLFLQTKCILPQAAHYMSRNTAELLRLQKCCVSILTSSERKRFLPGSVLRNQSQLLLQLKQEVTSLKIQQKAMRQMRLVAAIAFFFLELDNIFSLGTAKNTGEWDTL